VSQGDPTDNALATIASILDHSGTRRGPDRSASPAGAVSQDKNEDKNEEKSEQKSDADSAPSEKAAAAPEKQAATAVDAEGYSKLGPGPIASIRFKWTVRRGDDGQYYVHETVGDNTAPVVVGPLSPDDAIRMVDDREGEARHRFERLKAEMAARVDTAELIRLGGGEA
jgi:hypothetical protein